MFFFLFLGKYMLKQFTTLCKSCGERNNPFKMSTIMSSGYWFASPENFFYLFSNEVFEVWDSFRKNMPGSSEMAFLKSLDQFTENYGRVRLVLLVIIML